MLLSILVILGNPPYNGYSGIAKMDEERDLTTEYKNPIQGLPIPEGNGLNNLYIRFFRVAERRIVQNHGGKGIICFISAYSWLDGLSHPVMRHRVITNFDQVFIDNLHGDRKISEYAPDGSTSETVFAVSGNSVGIRVGTAVSTLVRTGNPLDSSIRYRDFTDGRAGTRREAMLESLNESVSGYQNIQPDPRLGLPFKLRDVREAYFDWPRITELFLKSFPCIKTSRDPLVVDHVHSNLVTRMQWYHDPSISNELVKERVPSALENGNRFDGTATRASLIERGFREWQIFPYMYRPFDLRNLYWDPDTKLLDEKRENYVRARVPTALTLILPRQNRVTVDGPIVTYQLADIKLGGW